MTGTLWRSTNSCVFVLADAGLPPVSWVINSTSAGNHPIPFAEEKPGSFLLLLAAGGKRPGKNRQEADFKRVQSLREELRCRIDADERARLDHHTPRDSR